MADLENQAESEVKEYLRILKNSGYDPSLPEKGNYCIVTTISGKTEKVKLLVYYGKKGITKVLQGNRNSEFFKGINQLLFNELPFENKEFEEPSAYIGTDESGKGDYFGPLVIAGVLVDDEKKRKLNEIGVRDSKLISHNSIRKLSDNIKKISGGNSFNIVVINPPRYNELYDKFRNLNKLLAWGHAKVLENILSINEADTAVSDKFGDEKLIIQSLQEKGKQLELHQFHRAERYTAVAAASILARDRFNYWFEVKEKELKTVLPKGSSDLVTQKAKLIKSQYGEEFLQQLTKTHFKTSAKL